MPKTTGIVKIYVNGTLRRSKAGTPKIIFGGYERTVQKGHSVYGFSEELMPSTVEWTEVHMGDTDIDELRNLQDATVRFVTDSGKSYICHGMFTTKAVELSAGEGEMAIEMMGQPAVEE